MTFLQILKIICAIGTVATGFISLLAPRSIRGFTGLEATGPRGITEIRAVMGALFIGLGIAPFILGTQAVYQALGIMYLAIALVRAPSRCSWINRWYSPTSSAWRWKWRSG